jgi:uncharacterized protein YqfA (UPF0365 family)
MDKLLPLIGVGVALLGLIIVFVFAVALFAPWVRSLLSGAPVPMFALLGMRLRGTPVRLVCDAYVELLHRGASVTVTDIERAYLANRSRVRNARDLVDLAEASAAAPPAARTTP